MAKYHHGGSGWHVAKGEEENRSVSNQRRKWRQWRQQQRRYISISARHINHVNISIIAKNQAIMAHGARKIISALSVYNGINGMARNNISMA